MAKCTGERRVYHMSRGIHKSSRNKTLNMGTNQRTQSIGKGKSTTMKKLRSKRHKNEQLVNDSSKVPGTKDTCNDNQLVNDVSEVLSPKMIRNDSKLVNNVSVVSGMKKAHKGERLINGASEVSGTITMYKDNVSDLSEVPDKKNICVYKKPINNVSTTKKLQKDNKFTNYISAVPSNKKACKANECINEISKMSRAKKKDKDKKLIKKPFKVLRCREKDNGEKNFNDSSKVSDSKIKYTDADHIDNMSKSSRANKSYNSENNMNDSFKKKIKDGVHKDTTMVLRSKDRNAKRIGDSSKMPRVKEIDKSKRLFDISSELLKSKKKYTDGEPIDNISRVSCTDKSCIAEKKIGGASEDKIKNGIVDEDTPWLLRSKGTDAKLINDSSKVFRLKEIRKGKRIFNISSKLVNSKEKNSDTKVIDDLSGVSRVTEPCNSENNLDDAFIDKNNDHTVTEDLPMVLRSRHTSAKLLDDSSKKPYTKKIRKNNKLFVNSSKVLNSKNKLTVTRPVDDKLKIFHTNKPCDTEICINGASKTKTNDASVDEDTLLFRCFKDVCARLIDDLSKIPRTARIRKNVKLFDNLSKVPGSKKKCTHAELIDDKLKLSHSNEPCNAANNLNDTSHEKTTDGKLVENLPTVLCSEDKRSNPKPKDHSSKMPAYTMASTLKKLSRHRNCFEKIIWHCDICHLEFTTKYNLQRHMKRYANPQVLCDNTGTKFPDIKQQCRDVAGFKCPICSQTFNVVGPFQAHMYHYHDGGLGTLQQKYIARLPMSATSKQLGVDVNRKSLKNTEKSCTQISKQPILPNPVEAATQCKGSCAIKEKMDENEIATTDDAKVIEISKTTISEVEVGNKNDGESLGHEQRKFAILNNMNNREPPKHVENSLVESQIRIGDKDEEMMDNSGDKHEIRSFDIRVTVAKENYVAEESFQVSQNCEEIEKTDSTRFDDTRLDVLKYEKTDEQRKLTNPSQICEESGIIGKDGVFNDPSINMTEERDMAEEQFELSHNCEGTGNADQRGVLNNASDNIVEGKNMTGKLFESSPNSEVIEKTVGVINVLDPEKPPEILQDCNVIENSDKNIIFNEMSIINAMEENDEVEKPSEILQKCKTIVKAVDIHLIDDLRLNESDEMNEQDKSFGISLNIEDTKNTDKNEVLNETIVNVPHEKDVGGEPFEISLSCGKIQKASSTRLVDNVNVSESEKSDEPDKSLGISQKYKKNFSIDKSGVFQNSSDSEAEETDYETSLEISHNFEETERIDKSRLITYTNFNLLRKMHGTKEIPNISENFEESDYRSFDTDVTSIDSMEDSESDHSEIAEALDDILQDAYEKPDDPVNEASLLSFFNMNTLVNELEVLLVKIKISNEEKKSSTILKDDEKTGKINFLTNNMKNNEAYDLTRPNRSNLAKSHNESPREMLKNDVNTKHNETSKNTENDNMKSGNEGHVVNKKFSASVSEKIEAPFSQTIINVPAVKFTIPKILEYSNNYEKIDLADNTISLNSTERTHGKDIAPEKSQDGGNVENKNSNDFSSDISSSSDSEESILSEFADVINDILKESLESDEKSSLHKMSRFEHDDALRAQYSCKHCYVSVMRLNINDLKAIKSKKSTAETIDERPKKRTECQANSSSVVLPCSMCPEMFLTEALRRKHIDNVHCNVPHRYYNQIAPMGQPSRRRCRTRHFADCDDKETCECDKDLIGRRTSNDQRRGKNRAVQRFPKITNMPNRSSDKCERCPNCGETFWLRSFLQLHLLQCKKFPPIEMLPQRAIKKFRREFGQGPMHPDERKCRICNALFQSSDKLFQHEQLYARAKIHRCSVCGTGFPDVNLLYDHTTAAHVSGAYFCYCPLCHQGFTGDLHRNVHTMHIHDDTVMIDRTIRDSPPVLHLEKKSDDVSIRRCDVCQLVFINRKRFIEHAIYYKRDTSIRCNLCNAEFDGQYSAHSHNKMLHYSAEMRNAYPHSCTICREGFIYERHLQAHVYHVHRKPFKRFGSLDVRRVTGLPSIAKRSSGCSLSPNGLVKMYTCNVCEMSFLTADLLAAHHIEYSKGGRFSCTRCDKNWQMASLLLDHLSLNHSEAINECVRCLSCNESLLNPSDGMSHVKHFHSNDAKESSEFYVETNIASVNHFGINQSDLIPKNRPISDGSAYKKIEMEIDRDRSDRAVCLIDATKLEKQGTIQKKLSEQQTEKQKYIGQASNDQQIEKFADEKKWSCAVCSVSFRSSTQLAKHASLWTDEGSYTCEVCGRRFKLRRFYQEHRMKHFRCHAKEDRHFCASCNEGFETMQLMTMHKAHVHAKKVDKLSSEAMRVLKFAPNSNQNRQTVPPREQTISACSADSLDLREKRSHRQKKHSVDDVPYDRVTPDSGAVITIDDFKKSSTLPSTTAVKRKNVEVITITDELPNAVPAKVLALKKFIIQPARIPRISQLTGVNKQLASSLNLHFVGDTSAVPASLKRTNVAFDATVAPKDLDMRTTALNGTNAWPVAFNATNTLPVTLSGMNAHGITVNGANLGLMAIDATDIHQMVNFTTTSPVLSNNRNARKARPVVPMVPVQTSIKHAAVPNATVRHPVSQRAAVRHLIASNAALKHTAVSNAIARYPVTPNCIIRRSVTSDTPNTDSVVSNGTNSCPVGTNVIIRRPVTANTPNTRGLALNIIKVCPVTPNTPSTSVLVSKVTNVCPPTPNVTITRSASSPSTRNIFVTVVKTPDGTSIAQKNSFNILRCKSCNIMFSSVDQLNSHELSAHGLKATGIQIIDDITLRKDNASVSLFNKSLTELQWLVNSLPVTSNRPIDRIHVTKHHADLDFQAVNSPITAAKRYKLMNKTFDGMQNSTIVPSSALATANEASECTVLIDKESSHHVPAKNTVQNITGFLNQSRRKAVTKRKSEPTTILQQEEKKSRESSYDPIVFEEVCRQHSLSARSTIKKNEVPVITLL